MMYTINLLIFAGWVYLLAKNRDNLHMIFILMLGYVLLLKILDSFHELLSCNSLINL